MTIYIVTKVFYDYHRFERVLGVAVDQETAQFLANTYAKNRNLNVHHYPEHQREEREEQAEHRYGKANHIWIQTAVAPSS